MKIDPTLLYSEANFTKSFIETLTADEIRMVLEKMSEFKIQKEKWLKKFKQERNATTKFYRSI
jgi:hypothetical protein